MTRVPLNHSYALFSSQILVFVDELNTSTVLGCTKEVLVDRTIDGTPLEDNIFFVAAINPASGELEARGATTNHTGVEGNIIQGDFVVKSICPSLKALVLDFGTMESSQEEAFLSALLQDQNISVGKYFGSSAAADGDDDFATAINFERLRHLMHLVLCSQQYLREYRNAGAIESRIHVSIRDIMRAVKLYLFFSDRGRADGIFQAEEDSDQERHWKSLLMSIALAYYLRLPISYGLYETRRLFATQIRENLEALHAPQQFRDLGVFANDTISRFFDHVFVPTGVAATRALQEHVFCMAVCIENKIPLIVTGPPGCSKTLGFTIAAENMRGSGSRKGLFQKMPKVSRFNYQCSEQSTAADIEAVARDAEARQAILHLGDAQRALSFISIITKVTHTARSVR